MLSEANTSNPGDHWAFFDQTKKDQKLEFKLQNFSFKILVSKFQLQNFSYTHSLRLILNITFSQTSPTDRRTDGPTIRLLELLRAAKKYGLMQSLKLLFKQVAKGKKKTAANIHYIMYNSFVGNKTFKSESHKQPILYQKGSCS